jgi:hypothetical protein
MPPGEAGERPSATIWFETDRPIPIPVLSNILNAANRDYKRAFRRDLTLAALQRGSTGLRLEDMAAFADQINHLFEFVRNIRLFISMVIPGFIGFASTPTDHPNITVHESAAAIAKAAIKMGSSARVESRSANGDELKIRIEEPQAHKIIAADKHSRLRRRAADDSEDEDHPGALAERILDVFETRVGSDDFGATARGDVFDFRGPTALMIRALIGEILYYHNGISRILRIAHRLRELGHFHAASWIEQTAHELNRRPKPMS